MNLDKKNQGVNSQNNNHTRKEKYEPQYVAVHARRFTSKILKKDVELFYESLIDFVVKANPSEKDRSKQIFFNIPEIGKISLSKSNGRVVVDTNRKDPFYAIKKYVGEPIYRSLMENRMQTQVSVHIPKIALKNKAQSIHTYFLFPGTDIPITFTASKQTNYVDFTLNIKMPDSLLEKLIDTPRVLPIKVRGQKYKRRYVKENEILDFAIRNGFIMTKDAFHFGLKKKSLGYRLNRLAKQEKLEKVGQSPAVYYPID